jgi:hypothetical protein
MSEYTQFFNKSLRGGLRWLLNDLHQAGLRAHSYPDTRPDHLWTEILRRVGPLRQAFGAAQTTLLIADKERTADDPLLRLLTTVDSAVHQLTRGEASDLLDGPDSEDSDALRDLRRCAAELHLAFERVRPLYELAQRDAAAEHRCWRCDAAATHTDSGFHYCEAHKPGSAA